MNRRMFAASLKEIERLPLSHITLVLNAEILNVTTFKLHRKLQTIFISILN